MNTDNKARLIEVLKGIEEGTPVRVVLNKRIGCTIEPGTYYFEFIALSEYNIVRLRDSLTKQEWQPYVSELDDVVPLADRIEAAGLLAGLDGDGPCFYCGEPTVSVAGNPGKWPLVFAQHDGTGKAKYHHVECVSRRLAGSVGVPSVEELESRLEDWWNRERAREQDGVVAGNESTYWPSLAKHIRAHLLTRSPEPKGRSDAILTIVENSQGHIKICECATCQALRSAQRAKEE